MRNPNPPPQRPTPTARLRPGSPISKLATLESVAVMRINPGDVLVFRTPHKLHARAIEGIRATLADLFPLNRCLILEDGATLEIAREEGEAEAASR